MIKVAAPNMLCRVLDFAIQATAAPALPKTSASPKLYTSARTLGIVDGPDEVHRNQIATLELRKHRASAGDAARRQRMDAA